MRRFATQVLSSANYSIQSTKFPFSFSISHTWRTPCFSPFSDILLIFTSAPRLVPPVPCLATEQFLESLLVSLVSLSGWSRSRQHAAVSPSPNTLLVIPEPFSQVSNATYMTSSLPTLELRSPAFRCNRPWPPYTPILFSHLFKIRKHSTKLENIDKTSGHQKQLKTTKSYTSIRFPLYYFSIFPSRFVTASVLLSGLLARCTITVYSVPLALLPLAASNFQLNRLPSGLPSVRISLLAATLPSSLTCHPLFCSASPFSSYPDPAPSLSRCDPHFLFIRVLFHPIFPSFRPLPVPPFHLAAAFLPTSLLPVLPGPILNSSFRYPCNDARPCPCL